ncbi:hypothetical protein SS1G_05988 [Sclerotinia sclerotiorum 1980 UF-70]|uniref:Uncharacterized protein n=1 Tax=Sclerotinia sclerotiorum (strain ATCC 18683 / 1980 / Ss-1) TaxID=665079 RepID=A7EKZ1_SCLS1|nr:hypothetical protein SS1G_05988 [Sclerotinia sclerotiorum 1980 UF-70]EDO03507.1 hypothetical protein SS1G_05988 [Sclerotinia sclerotiorum 1980 UF-70]
MAPSTSLFQCFMRREHDTPKLNRYEGSGPSVAVGFQNRGLHVFATPRTFSEISHLEDLPNITLLELDVINSQSIIAALDAIKAQMSGKLGYLVSSGASKATLMLLSERVN